MEAPSPRYIISRAVFLIAVLVAVLFSFSFYKKKQRQSAIIAELKSLSSDSSFFQQFFAEDAQKSLVRAIALIAEANQLGVPPETAIDRSVGIEAKSFFSEEKREDPTPRSELIRSSLRSNYENFLKLGYTPDFHTLESMKGGSLPPIPSGPGAGKRPVIGTIIDPSLSPGIDKVMANLEIRPPQAESRAPSDVEVSSAKRLASELAEARIIEESVRDRILKSFTKP